MIFISMIPMISRPIVLMDFNSVNLKNLYYVMFKTTTINYLINLEIFLKVASKIINLYSLI